MQFINTSLFAGLSIWMLGFALMTAGWLVDVLFEDFWYVWVLAKILYKLGAIIVAVPVILMLWRLSRLLSTHAVDIVIFLKDAVALGESLMKSF